VDNHNPDNMNCNCPDCTGGDFESPNLLLKSYIDNSRPFPYEMDSVQALINFANSASRCLANTGRLLESLMREGRRDLSAIMANGDAESKDAQLLRSTIKKFDDMNHDLKVICLSVNCMAAGLITTAKMSAQSDPDN
jgi:hypothetical protein